MKYKPFQCPYEEISCIYVDTTTCTLDQECKTCKYYNNGVKRTGGMPILGSIYESMIQFYEKHTKK